MTVDESQQCAPARTTKCRHLVAGILCGGLIVATAATAGAASGPELFAKHCAPCHGKDGRAQTPAARKLGVKDLSISKSSDAEMEKQIIEGKKDDRGTQKMPPFKEKLSPAEISTLLELVKGFRK